MQYIISACCIIDWMGSHRPVCMQALLGNLLAEPLARQLGDALFQRLTHMWPAKQYPEQHAKILVLQASLSGLLAADNSAISLLQQAMTQLSLAEVSKCCSSVIPALRITVMQPRVRFSACCSRDIQVGMAC